MATKIVRRNVDKSASLSGTRTNESKNSTKGAIIGAVAVVGIMYTLGNIMDRPPIESYQAVIDSPRPTMQEVSRGGLDRRGFPTSPTAVYDVASQKNNVVNNIPIENIKMPTKTTMPRAVFEQLKQKGEKYGLPIRVWYPIAMYESSGDPFCNLSNSEEDSRGIFQVNILAHPEADKERLYDVEYNADYQMPVLKESYEDGKSKGLTGTDLIFYVIKYGQRPKWSDKKTRAYIIKTVNKEYAEISKLYGVTE